MSLRGEQLKPLQRVKKEESTVEAHHIPISNWLGRICRMQNHSCLFFYCDSDPLNMVHEIEESIKIIESHGNSVEKVAFKGSDHVQHYRKYPDVR
jgi:hypothetical protein